MFDLAAKQHLYWQLCSAATGFSVKITMD